MTAVTVICISYAFKSLSSHYHLTVSQFLGVWTSAGYLDFFRALLLTLFTVSLRFFGCCFVCVCVARAHTNARTQVPARTRTEFCVVSRTVLWRLYFCSHVVLLLFHLACIFASLPHLYAKTVSKWCRAYRLMNLLLINMKHYMMLLIFTNINWYFNITEESEWERRE